MELPDNPPDRDEELQNPKTALKKDRKARVMANKGRQLKNLGGEIPAKKSTTKELITKKLAQRLRKSKVGKVLGSRSSRRR